MKKLTLTILITLHISLFTIHSFSQPCLPEGITFTTQAEIDSFQINYPNCTEIEGDVIIVGDDITNLNGLNMLTSIYGGLNILYDDLLTDLAGIENLTSIGGGLTIGYNESLQNISSLSNITSINGLISFYKNDTLTNLSGLEGLTSIDSLHVGNGHYGLSNPSLLSLEGLNNVTNIVYDLVICANISLQNLSGLNNLNTIGGDVDINSNINLVNLSGLNNLSSIGGALSIGGYDNIAMPPGLLCDGNPSLAEITALSNLTNIGGDLCIFCNDALLNLSGLESLTTIGGNLRIGFALDDYILQLAAGNQSLMDIIGLQGISTIGGNVDIQDNSSLTSLTGLENIDASSIENLTIRYNNFLSDCEVQSICDYLATPNGEITIDNNAPGCNSQEEVEEACAQSVDKIHNINNLSIYPNPFSKTITIEFELKQPETITITIYNHLGEQIEKIEKKQSQGNQKIIWHAEGLTAGIYFCTLKTNEGMLTKKIIKL